ncbi:hypothetical protein TrVE_jg10475 [Triparma verrucosa]|uniref:ELMO domain-containing protein n=1 Tax=Triparma verrucosa TaxID=1606542 RepID=A0A9W7CGN1_9STRA|nr:hypothetical protein TrVE_jg10475 [Triparma verrucosa]
MSLIEAMGKAVEEVEGKASNGGAPRPPPSPSFSSIMPPPPPENSKTPPVAQVSVSGNMYGSSDSDSSSEGDSDDEGVGAGPRAVIVYDTDSDEEIEYDETTQAGRDAKEAALKAREVRRLERREKAKRMEEEAVLAAAAARAKVEVEGGGAGVQQQQQQQQQQKKKAKGLAGLGSLGSNFSAPGGEQVLNPSDAGKTDEFGITYKPMKRDYELPSGPAFADEAEFERDLDEKQFSKCMGEDDTGAGSDDDDEFDFDPASAVPVVTTTTTTNITTTATNSQVVEKSAKDDEQDNIIKSLMEEAHKTQLLNEGIEENIDIKKSTDSALNALRANLSAEPEREEREFVELKPTVEMRKGSLMGSVISEDDEVLNEEEEEEEEEAVQEEPPAVVRDDLEQAKDDWDKVESSNTKIGGGEEEQEQIEIGVGGIKVVEIADRPITFAEFYTTSINALNSSSTELPPITPYVAPRRSSFKNFLTGSPTLSLPVSSRDSAFHLANVNYTPSSIHHLRILRTIYRSLTSLSPPSSPTGPHWSLIGFQGLDPSTDLNRSGGILTLLSVLHLTTKYNGPLSHLLNGSPFLLTVYSESRSPGMSEWPFMCVAVNFTILALQSLRSGALYSHINEERLESCAEGVAEMVGGLFLEFYTMIKGGGGVHHAEHLAGIRGRVGKGKKEVKAIMAKWLELGRSGGVEGSAVGKFTDLEEEERKGVAVEGGDGGGGHAKRSKGYGV